MNVELRCCRRIIQRMNLYTRDYKGGLWSLHFPTVPPSVIEFCNTLYLNQVVVVGE